MILRAEGCAKIDDKFYFMAMDMNVFYSIRESDGKITYEGSIPGEEAGLMRGAKITSYNRTLIFMPLNAKCVSFYDIDSGEWLQIPVEPLEGYHKDKFFSAHIYNHKLILVGAVYPAIMIIDLNDYSVAYIREMHQERLHDAEEKRDCVIRADTVLLGNKLYMASCVSNHVGIVDLEDYSWKWVTVAEKECRFSGIAWDGKDFWLAPRKKGNIIKWNQKSDEYENVILNTDKLNFLGVIYDGMHVIFPGMLQDETIIINPLEFEKNPEGYVVWKKDYLFFMNCGSENFAMTRNGKFEVFCVQNIFEERKSYSTTTHEKEFLEEVIKTDEARLENPYITLNDYIKAIELL